MMSKIALFAIILALGVGLAAFGPRGDVAGPFEPERLSLPEMRLIDHNAMEHDLQGDLLNEGIVVVTFTYTLCQSICPIGNDVMARVDDLLADRSGRDVRLLSITIDPDRDTPMRLQEAAATFDSSDRWLWLTGGPRDIDSLLQSLDADYADITLHDPIFLIGDARDGRFYRSLSMPTADEIVAAIDSIAS